MSNTEARLALRPLLNLAPAEAPEESFQNNTLRPIMKMQHELLVAAFRLSLQKRKVKLEQLPANQRFDKIKQLITRDARLRGLLLGIAVGQFTNQEMVYFVENESSINRRMTNLLVERLASAVA